jgi:hypothetical protein
MVLPGKQGDLLLADESDLRSSPTKKIESYYSISHSCMHTEYLCAVVIILITHK